MTPRLVRPLVLLPATVFTVVISLACSSSSSSSSPTAVPTAAATRPATAAPTTAPVAAAPTTAPAPAAAPTTAAPPAAAPSPAAGAVASTVKIGDSSLGKVVTDSRGFTLYTFTQDVANSGQSTVTGGRLAAWPALKITGGTPVKPDGLPGALGVITRDDGSLQVSYKGLPLYLWQNDRAPGDVTGQNVGGFVIATP